MMRALGGPVEAVTPLTFLPHLLLAVLAGGNFLAIVARPDMVATNILRFVVAAASVGRLAAMM